MFILKRWDNFQDFYKGNLKINNNSHRVITLEIPDGFLKFFLPLIMLTFHWTLQILIILKSNVYGFSLSTLSLMQTHQTFTCSKSTIEKLQKDVKNADS